MAAIGSVQAKLNSFMSNARHILNVSYKPGPDEFNRTAKVIVLGILLIGVLGYVISLIVGYVSGLPI